MRSFKMIGVLAAVLALGVIGVANASAATFTSSAIGTLVGNATSTHILTTSAGQIKCPIAEGSGTIATTSGTETHGTVNYKNCAAFGFVNTDVSPATFLTTANGEVHLKNAITINVTGAGCSMTFGAQSLKTVSFTNNGGKVILTPNLTGIKYTATGGLCGTGGTAGIYTGTTEVERVGGGSLSYDP